STSSCSDTRASATKVCASNWRSSCTITTNARQRADAREAGADRRRDLAGARPFGARPHAGLSGACRRSVPRPLAQIRPPDGSENCVAAERRAKRHHPQAPGQEEAQEMSGKTPLDPAGPYSRHPLQPHQLVDRVTRTDDAIVLCHLGVARLDPDAWTLAIDGLVRRPLRLTLAELMRRPRATLTSIHQCCGSPLKPEQPTRRITNVVWGGVPLSSLLADCEPDPAARFVWSSGADHGVFSGVDCDAYVKDLPLARVAADVLIAYEMNGAPLRPEHGFPARLVIPG